MRTGPLVLACAIGFGAGSALWLVANAASGDFAWADPVSALSGVVSEPANPRVDAQPVAGDMRVILSRPLAGAAAGASADPSQMRLEGVSIHAGRSAALITLGQGASGWWTLGEEKAGVTLSRIASSGVVLQTASGPASLTLQARTESAPSMATAPAPQTGGEPGVR